MPSSPDAAYPSPPTSPFDPLFSSVATATTVTAPTSLTEEETERCSAREVVRLCRVDGSDEERMTDDGGEEAEAEWTRRLLRSGDDHSDDDDDDDGDDEDYVDPAFIDGRVASGQRPHLRRRVASSSAATVVSEPLLFITSCAGEDKTKESAPSRSVSAPTPTVLTASLPSESARVGRRLAIDQRQQRQRELREEQQREDRAMDDLRDDIEEEPLSPPSLRCHRKRKRTAKMHRRHPHQASSRPRYPALPATARSIRTAQRKAAPLPLSASTSSHASSRRGPSQKSLTATSQLPQQARTKGRTEGGEEAAEARSIAAAVHQRRRRMPAPSPSPAVRDQEPTPALNGDKTAQQPSAEAAAAAVLVVSSGRRRVLLPPTQQTAMPCTAPPSPPPLLIGEAIAQQPSHDEWDDDEQPHHRDFVDLARNDPSRALRDLFARPIA